MSDHTAEYEAVQKLLQLHLSELEEELKKLESRGGGRIYTRLGWPPSKGPGLLAPVWEFHVVPYGDPQPTFSEAKSGWSYGPINIYKVG